jgi:hypothetical protein
MCDVPSITLFFFSESTDCLPVVSSKFLFKLFVTIQVAPGNTGIITLHVPYSLCLSPHKLLWFYFLFYLFFHDISVCWYWHMSVCMFSHFVFNYCIWPRNSVSLCTPWFHSTVTFSCSHTSFLCVCGEGGEGWLGVCAWCVSFRCPVFSILSLLLLLLLLCTLPLVLSLVQLLDKVLKVMALL